MSSSSAVLFPSSVRTLKDFGARLRQARLRRNFSSETVATRAGISRPTLTKIERGDSSVTLGNYFQVLTVLGLDGDFGLLAKEDRLGRIIQDAELPRQRVKSSSQRIE